MDRQQDNAVRTQTKDEVIRARQTTEF